jgi:ribokinase
VVASFVVERPGTQTNLPDRDRMLARYRKVFGEPGEIFV